MQYRLIKDFLGLVPLVNTFEFLRVLDKQQPHDSTRI